MDKQTTKAVIYDSEHVRVIRNHHVGSTLFITFNEVELFVSRMRNNEFWGFHLFESMKVPAVGLVSTDRHWFPERAAIGAIEAVRRIIAEGGYKRVVAYGHSMGGYAALRYGAALGADVTIAFCPQYSIAPSDIGDWDKRYIQYHPIHGDEEMILEAHHLSRRVYVAYDPTHHLDAKHVAFIRGLGEVSEILLPCTEHSSVRLLAQSGSAALFLEVLAQDNNAPARKARQVIRRHRRRSPLYWRTLGQIFWHKRKDMHAAVQCFTTAISLDPKDATARIQLARILISLGQRENALHHLRTMPATLERLDKGQLERIVYAYQSLGMMTLALKAAEIRFKKFPHDTGVADQFTKVKQQLEQLSNELASTT